MVSMRAERRRAIRANVGREWAPPRVGWVRLCAVMVRHATEADVLCKRKRREGATEFVARYVKGGELGHPRDCQR